MTQPSTASQYWVWQLAMGASQVLLSGVYTHPLGPVPEVAAHEAMVHSLPPVHAESWGTLWQPEPNRQKSVVHE